MVLLLLASTTPFSLPYSETFTGADGGAWPGYWSSVTGGSATIQANKGRTTSAVGAYLARREDLSVMPATANTDITGTVTALASGVEQYAVIGINSDTGAATDWGGRNGYVLYLNYAATASSGSIQIQSVSSGGGTSLASVAKTLTGGVTYGFRFQRVGQVLNGRVWDAAGAEPSTWDLTWTEPGTPPTGFVTLAGAGGAVSNSYSFDWDNVTVAFLPTALPYTETFPGASGAAWPAVWTSTHASGTGSQTQTGSGTGQLVTAATANAAERVVATGLTAATDMDITGAVTFAAQQSMWLNIAINADDTTFANDASYTQNGYFLYLGVTASPATATLALQKQVAGARTDLISRATSPVPLTAGTATWYRFQRLGTTIRYKLWTGGAGAEPGAWTGSVTDSGAQPSTGQAALLWQNGSSTSGTVTVSPLTVSVPSSAPAFTAAVNLSGTGALDASSSTLSVATTAVFSATGGLSPVASPAPATAVVLSGTGSLTAVPSVKVSRTVVLAATGGLAAAGSPATTAPVGLSGSGNLAVTPVPNPRAAVTLSSTGTLTAIPTVTTGSPVTLGATGSLAVTGTPTVAGAVTLSGSGVLTGTGTPTATGAAAFSGSGSLTVTATTIAASTSVTLTATGSLAASGSAVTSQAVDLSATGGLMMAGSASPTVSVAFAASGSLLTTASPSVAASVSLSAVGALLVESGSNGSGTAVFSAVGALVPASSVQSSSAVLLTGSGLLVAAASQGSTTAVTLSGGGALDSGSSADFTSAVGFAALGQILTAAGPSATGSGSFSAVGVLSCIAAMRLATTTFFAITNVRSNGLVVEYERTAVQFGILDIQGESFALAGSRVRSMATATRSNPFSVRT